MGSNAHVPSDLPHSTFTLQAGESSEARGGRTVTGRLGLDHFTNAVGC
ncbi:hypothetical protein RISK_006020 [Rhodopirellula islandica]|uniref:Uncharacterized protein n=1 Tax=Rhodopirellula islandica TaxID=595434 RepID=A0A0J1B5S8_RHOIS|nr:hypothetical protein RISK_006020 [Rhodopirellula islandica]